MILIQDVGKMRVFSKNALFSRNTIGFVPTMGTLHEGHLSLVKQCQKKNDYTIVSIFVNPKQFDRQEDFLSYPYDLKKDIAFLKKLDVDVIFTPNVEEIYTKDFSVFIDVPSLSQEHCGQFRKDHFPFVCVIIMILLNIISPDFLYLGEKDYQQLCVIKKLLNDLKSVVKVVSCPTVREPHGLAMSSRNKLLGGLKRQKAKIIFETLQIMEQRIKQGSSSVSYLEQWGADRLNFLSDIRVEYLKIVDLNSLHSLEMIEKPCVILVAVFFGNIRLIDNLICHKES